MTKLINKNKLDSFANKLWKRITKSFVSKTLPNTVTGETMITDGYVGGESTITKMHNETRVTMDFLNHNTSFYGIPSLSVPARTYVDKIICIMHDSAEDIGATATGVNVGVVSKSTGRILEYLKRDQTETIIANPLTSGSHILTGNKAISISINRAWQEEVYFIVGAMKMMVGYINSLTPSVGGDNLREVGDNLGSGTGGSYIGRMAIYTSKYSLNEIATKSLSIDDIKNDYVSKTKENLVTGKTTLLDGRLLHNALSVVNNTNAIHHINENSSWCGSPNLTVSANSKISYVCIAVKDDLEIGTRLNNIKLAAVKSSDNQVYRILTVDSALIVKNTLGHISSSKIIMVPVNIAFDTQVYFITGFNGMKWGNTPSGSNWPTIWTEGRSFPAVGTTLRTNLTNYVPQWFVLSEELGLNDVVTSVNTKASKNDSNTFDSTNIFNANVKLNDSVDIKYKHYIQQLLLDGDTKHGSDWAVYFDRNIYIPTGSYVTYLDIRVTDDVNAGSELADIYIYEVHRGDSISNDRIVRTPNNLRFRIFDVDGYGKCIRVQFNRKFDRDTYCIIGQKMVSGKILMGNDTKGDIRRAIINKPFVLNNGHNILSESRPTNNKVIHRYNIERVGILQDDINNINNVLATTIKNTDIGNEANKIPRVGSNGKLDPRILPAEQNGGVRTVNGQSPGENGNVTVLAEHIKYHANTTLNMKQAIDGKVNESDTSNVGGSGQGNKVVKLDGNGKLNDNMLPTTIAKRINGQTVNNNEATIYSDNINIDSSTNKTIKQALNEGVQKGQNNNFTKKNDFNFYAPTVTKSFTRMSFNDNDRLTNRVYNLYNNNSANYFVTLSDKFEDTGLTVSYLLLPIKNSQVGDRVSATWFVLRDNRRIHTDAGYFREYTVEDIDMVGCKCIRIPVNVRYTERVMFGFSVQTRSVGGRTIGMAYANDLSYSKEVWTGGSPNQLTNFTNNSAKKVFPYKILYDTTSEVVTRFELEQVTQMYPKTLIGEYKNISYDAGNSLDDGMNTWLKASGQTVTNTDYPELFEKLNPNRTINDLDNIQVETFELPNETAAAGYYYICAK